MLGNGYDNDDGFDDDIMDFMENVDQHPDLSKVLSTLPLPTSPEVEDDGYYNSLPDRFDIPAKYSQEQLGGAASLAIDSDGQVCATEQHEHYMSEAKL